MEVFSEKFSAESLKNTKYVSRKNSKKKIRGKFLKKFSENLRHFLEKFFHSFKSCFYKNVRFIITSFFKDIFCPRRENKIKIILVALFKIIHILVSTCKCWKRIPGLFVNLDSEKKSVRISAMISDRIPKRILLRVLQFFDEILES